MQKLPLPWGRCSLFGGSLTRQAAYSKSEELPFDPRTLELSAEQVQIPDTQHPILAIGRWTYSKILCIGPERCPLKAKLPSLGLP